MNIDLNIVRRALQKAGQEPIKDADIKNNNTIWRLIKDYYLSTILETLSNTDWTSQKKRKALVLSEEENLSPNICMYDLPEDCAKPCALVSDEDYVVEGNNLYTDDTDAVLIYISNGYTGKEKYKKADPQPTSDNFSEGSYYTYDSETDVYTLQTAYEEGAEYYVLVEEDYTGYDDLNLDPLLSAYIETRLAAKMVLKITGETDKYQLLYSEAQQMEIRAIKASSAHGNNKATGNKYWGDSLGWSDGVTNVNY